MKKILQLFIIGLFLSSFGQYLNAQCYIINRDDSFVTKIDTPAGEDPSFDYYTVTVNYTTTSNGQASLLAQYSTDGGATYTEIECYNWGNQGNGTTHEYTFPGYIKIPPVSILTIRLEQHTNGTCGGSICGEEGILIVDLPVPIANPDINQTPVNHAVSGNILTNDVMIRAPKVVTSVTYTDQTGVHSQSFTGNNPITFQTTGIDDNLGPVSEAGTIVLYTDGSYTFTPTNDFIGTITPVDYSMMDDTKLVANSNLNIIVTPNINPAENHVPIAKNDTGITLVNTTLNGGTILANDSDPDGAHSGLSLTGATQGSTVIPIDGGTAVQVSAGAVLNAGTLTIHPDGTYTFVPATDFVGDLDPVHYSIVDSNGGTAEADIFIKVVPKARENYTFANDDANSSAKGVLQVGDILLNDTDPENDNQKVINFTYLDVNGNEQTVIVDNSNPQTVTIYYKDTANGNAIIEAGDLTIQEDGSYTYQPTATFVGTALVVYEIEDDNPQIIANDLATLYLTTLDTTASSCITARVLLQGGLVNVIDANIYDSDDIMRDDIRAK
ncbi:MAG: cadherin-like domain-containing protein, partial [Acholeplasmataceae bacterium]|nr:cadherin-like domain-containing protein [Acholeplasmataceae bacterium]